VEANAWYKATESALMGYNGLKEEFKEYGTKQIQKHMRFSNHNNKLHW
jgi:hypothetical protein